jgi:hypothetical protein
MPQMDIEKQIDVVLEQERTARTEEARAALRARFVEKERLARLAEEQAVQSAARARYLERAAAAHGQACDEYKKALGAFRQARIRLQALDTILGPFRLLGASVGHRAASRDRRA